LLLLSVGLFRLAVFAVGAVGTVGAISSVGLLCSWQINVDAMKLFVNVLYLEAIEDREDATCGVEVVMY
jgi:hypothetical protein